MADEIWNTRLCSKKSIKSFIMNTRPIFIGDGESTDMLDVLPRELTLNNIDARFYPKTCARPAEETIFKEVKYKPFEYSAEMGELFGRDKCPPTGMRGMYEILKESIERTWDPTKFHVIGHSSGVDSRIICKAVCELTEKHGDDWAGDVLYVENGGEGDLFNQIKEITGINGIAFNWGAEPGWYNEPFFRFDDFYKKYNGPVAYPMNQWYDSYNRLYEEGVIPKKDIQGYTGYGANETQQKAVRNHKGYAWYFPWVHQLQLSLFKHWGGDWEHPFLDIDFLHALNTNEFCNTHKTRFNILLAAEVAPELYHIPHIHTKQVIKRGYRHVDPILLKKLYDTYRQSWFGSQFDVRTESHIEYREWWFFYCVASFCEHLLKNGYKIKV